MSSNLRLDAIDPHTYGLNAAQALELTIDQIFISTDSADVIKSIASINQISDLGLRDRAMQALIHYAATGDRAAAIQSIKDYEYIAAHLHLGKQMHALAQAEQSLQMRNDLPQPVINEMPAYPQHDASYRPAATSITEILCESIQASNAPSAAISAATCSI